MRRRRAVPNSLAVVLFFGLGVMSFDHRREDDGDQRDLLRAAPCSRQPLNPSQRLQKSALERLSAPGGGVRHKGWDSLFDAAVIINMPARTKRRIWMESVLNESRATHYTIHPAIDRNDLENEARKWRHRMVIPHQPHKQGDRLTWETNEKLWPPNRSAFAALAKATQPGMRSRLGLIVGNFATHACYLSHLSVLVQADQRGYETVLILEDDIRLANPSTFHVTLFEAVAALPKDWEIFSMGHSIHHDPCSTNETIVDACGAVRLCRVRGNIMNNAAYVVHRRALRWLLPLLQEPLQPEHAREVFLPLDLTLRAHYITHPEVRVYASATPLIQQLHEVLPKSSCSKIQACHSGIGDNEHELKLYPIGTTFEGTV